MFARQPTQTLGTLLHKPHIRQERLGLAILEAPTALFGLPECFILGGFFSPE